MKGSIAMRRYLFILLSGVGVALTSIGCGLAENKEKNENINLSVDYDAVYVVNGQEATISVLESPSGEVRATISIPEASYPHHISLNPDLTKLAVAIPGMDLSGGHEGSQSTSNTPASGGHSGGHGLLTMHGKVVLMDAKTGEVLKSKQLPSMNHNAIFSPDGQEIWTSQMVDEGSVMILDAESLEQKSEIKVGRLPAEVSFSLDGKRAFVANGGDDTVTIIDPSTKDTITTLAVGDNPVGAWQGADGLMYVDNESGKSISVIDPAVPSLVRTIELGFTPGMAATGPEETLWVTDTDNGKVVIFSTDGSKKSEIVSGPGAHGLVFSNDNKLAFVSNQSGGTLTVIDVASATVKVQVAIGSKPNGLVFRRNKT